MLKSFFLILLVFSPCLQAQTADISGVCNGSQTFFSRGMQYPVEYFVANCQFQMEIKPTITSPVYETKTMKWDTSDSCATRKHYIYFDNNAYLVSSDYYFDFAGIANIVWVKQSLNNCHTLSGNQIINNNINPVLLGNSFIFDLSTTNVDIKLRHYSDNTDVLSFNSANGDIVCDGATNIPSLDIIFKHGFDLEPNDFIFAGGFE